MIGHIDYFVKKAEACMPRVTQKPFFTCNNGVSPVEYAYKFMNVYIVSGIVCNDKMVN